MRPTPTVLRGRYGAGLFFAGILAVLIASLAITGGAHSSPPFPAPDVQAQLLAAAQKFAAGNGDANPTADYIVAGQRGALVKGAMLGGDLNDTDAAQDVYLVELKGSFVGYSMPRPAEVPPPHGRFLRVNFDASTYEMLDWMIGDDVVNLSSFGDARPEPIRNIGRK